jgi:broad specificity phosphatase PhoE
LAAAHIRKDVVIVSHGGVMTTLWAYVAGTWNDAYAPPNCGMVLIEHGPQGYSKPQVVDAAESAQHAGG